MLTDCSGCSGGVSAVLSSPVHFLIVQKLSNSNLHALLGSRPSSTRALCNRLFEFLGLCDYFLDLITATFHAIFHGLWIQRHCEWNIRHSLFKGPDKPLEMIRDFELSFFKIYGHPPPPRRMDFEPLLSDRSCSRTWNSKSNSKNRNSCQSHWSV